jgi:hypothetical protein
LIALVRRTPTTEWTGNCNMRLSDMPTVREHPPLPSPAGRRLLPSGCINRSLPLVFALIAVLGGLVLPAAGADDAEPPFHPSVGQKFIPPDVDWDHPVYRTRFDDASEVSHWRLEGGTRVSIANGKLVLESEPGQRPGSLVCWLTTELPAEFLLEFSVRPRDRNDGLNIVFFSTRGVNEESIFDPALKPRNGGFSQYHSGDIKGYHISYWASGRGTVNVRKNPGFALVATGPDRVREAPADSFQVVRLYKKGRTIRLMVDDVISVAFDDDGRSHGPVWNHPGWIGLRQMGTTVRCEYDHLAVYPLKP